MSVFLAIDLDAAARAQATALIEAHRATHEAKWLRPDKLHCTLTFLGNPKADQVEAWKPLIDALAARHHPFRLELAGAGTFLTARAPSVLWLGVEGQLDAVRALQHDTQATLGSAVGHQQREYLPHVTLARSQGADHFEGLVTALRDFRSDAFQVAHVSLYESTNHVYRVLHQARLRTASSRTPR